MYGRSCLLCCRKINYTISENFNFYFIETLNGSEVYMDCSGKLGGSSIMDTCGICGGSGPQYYCEDNEKSYCTEYEYEQKCIHSDSN